MAFLTPRQERVLAFLRHFVQEKGFPPTHAEIAEALGFRSANAAAEHLRLMAKKGVVTIQPGVSRGLRILESAAEHELPLIGQVAAGQPLLAIENVERTVAVDPGLFRPRADYLLRVRGDSMIEAGILSGDLVAVHKTASVLDGQIAVVRLEDEVTVKRWRRRRRQAKGSDTAFLVSLEPANAAFEPIMVDLRSAQVAIEGLVVGLLRVDQGPKGRG